jgi:hypothetical protein
MLDWQLVLWRAFHLYQLSQLNGSSSTSLLLKRSPPPHRLFPRQNKPRTRDPNNKPLLSTFLLVYLSSVKFSCWLHCNR